MKKKIETRLIISTLLASAMTTASFTIEKWSKVNSYWWFVLLIIIISSLLSYIIPRGISWLFFKLKLLRELFFDKAFLEGYWLLKSATGNAENLHRIGLAEITYNHSKDSYQIIVTRINEDGKIFRTNTKSFVQLDDETNIVNFFTYTIGNRKIEGISSGQFTYSSANTIIDTYDGRIVTYDSNEIVVQTGYRIPEKTVRYLKNRYHQEWMATCIKEAENERP